MEIYVHVFASKNRLDQLANSIALQWDTIQPVVGDTITFDEQSYTIVDRVITYSAYHVSVEYEIAVLYE